MEYLDEIRMLRVPADLLKQIHETQYLTIRLLIFRIFNFCVIILVGTYIFVNLFYVKNETFIKTMQSLIHMTHLLLKYFFLIYYKLDIGKLSVSISENFWNIEAFEKNVKVRTQKVYNIVERIQKCLLFVTIMLGCLYISKPLLDKNNSFLLETYIPRSNAIDAFLLMSQLYCFFIGIVTIVGFDLIYFSLCVHVIIQIKLLKEKLKNSFKSFRKNAAYELSSCIKHHQYLFSMFLRMKEIYSIMLLFHYFVTLLSVCSVVFEILSGHTDLSNYLLKFMMVLFFVVQFAYYALPAAEVASEFSDVSQAIYTSEWYNSDIKLQKSMLFIMMKCQQIHYFSGGDLMDINTDTLGSVIRKIFSFYTILRNLIDK
uniref:Odorant receptor n=1 Tax=Holotrichia parallela TaxID=93412 RepID=A0A2P9JY42_HOLPA|nr:odorant receptor 1 [Holotrichia parallela]